MSEFRVALVAEGPTDAVVIEAALKAVLPGPFILTLRQPEATRPKLGSGWGGVLRWCQEFQSRAHNSFEDDPTLPGFDLFVLHIDADVSHMSYEDVGPKVALMAKERGWPALPNALPCPPATAHADLMRACMLSWAGLSALGPKTVLCVPSQAIEAWLIAAIFPPEHPLMKQIECAPKLSDRLKILPKAERIRKATRHYQAHAAQITQAWRVVRERCTQADRLSAELEAIFD